MLLFYLSMLETPEEKQRFAAIYEANRKLMFSVAKGILHDDFLAEDAVSEAFMKAISQFKTFHEISSNQTRKYLVVIVRNAAIDMYNRRRKVVEVSFGDSYETDHEQENVGAQLEYNELLKLTDQLPDIYKEVLYLAYILQLSTNEIADSLGITTNAVKQRLLRARQKMREVLKEVEAMEGVEAK